MFSLIVLAALAQPPAAEVATGAEPVQGLAAIDTKGHLTIWRVSPTCYGQMHQEIDLKSGNPKDGDKDKVVAKAKVTNLQLTVVEMPAKSVEAYTVDGKAIAADKLAELLAKERTVLITTDGKKSDPFHLQLYKEGTIVLVPPASIWGPDQFATPFGPPGVVPTPLPEVPPPPLPKLPPNLDRKP